MDVFHAPLHRFVIPGDLLFPGSFCRKMKINPEPSWPVHKN
jgi:hypothetical protein